MGLDDFFMRIINKIRGGRPKTAEDPWARERRKDSSTEAPQKTAPRKYGSAFSFEAEAGISPQTATQPARPASAPVQPAAAPARNNTPPAQPTAAPATQAQPADSGWQERWLKPRSEPDLSRMYEMTWMQKLMERTLTKTKNGSTVKAAFKATIITVVAGLILGLATYGSQKTEGTISTTLGAIAVISGLFLFILIFTLLARIKGVNYIASIVFAIGICILLYYTLPLMFGLIFELFSRVGAPTELIGLHWIAFGIILFAGIIISLMPQQRHIRIIVIIGYLIFAVILMSTISVPGGTIGGMVLKATAGWWEQTKELFSFAEKEYERAIAMATGDWYAAEVDEDANKNLGVQIEKVKSVGEMFEQNETIQTYAIISAESIGNKPVPITLSCYADKEEITGEVKPAQINVSRLQKTEADCTISSEEMDTGAHKIYFRAEFPFTTKSYYKTYFMQQNVRRQYETQGIDPFKEAKIEDSRPTAKYTEGPIAISIGTQSTPPLNLIKGDGQTFGISFENSWNGDLGTFKSIGIIIPKGFSITSINTVEGIECVEIPDTEDQNCKLKEGQINEIFKDTEQEIRTMRVRTSVDPAIFMAKDGGEEIIKAGRIGVTAEYDYTLERSTTVQVRAPL